MGIGHEDVVYLARVIRASTRVDAHVVWFQERRFPAVRRRRRHEDRFERRIRVDRQLDARRKVECRGALGEDARPADGPARAACRERASALLQHDDGFFVVETKRGGAASLEAQTPGAELARAGDAALLQDLDAGLSRVTEKRVVEHGRVG